MSDRVLLLALLAGASFLGGCASIGSPESICDQNPASCPSARQAYMASNGYTPIPGESAASQVVLVGAQGNPGLTSPRTDTVALESGQAMRVWTAPTQDAGGALHSSSYVFVDLQGRQARVGQTDFYWTAPEAGQ